MEEKTEHEFEGWKDGAAGQTWQECKNCGYKVEHWVGSGTMGYTQEFFKFPEYLKCPKKK